MQLEPLRDVMHWTEAVHHQLAQCLRNSAMETEDERGRMLMRYLADHEKTIENLLKKYERRADLKTLNAWYLEYINKEPVPDHRRCEKEFKGKDLEGIYHNVMMQHEQIIELYKFMRSRADTEEARELLQQLVDMEQHEAMRMAHATNRLEDL